MEEQEYTQPYADFLSSIRKIKTGAIAYLTYGEKYAIIERYQHWCIDRRLHCGTFNLLDYICRIAEEK